ncbi:MAG: PAS domain-containing protein [Gammaproteobacteria bacterium]|nr:PAS domain-containing protein [Gammaproteobacteria bacterium]NND39990.1 PAS domain-containing protein [Pseudomonadales bacterium]MBT8152300.1 PAS domain-containing protein [Gammaproteobacteria bacterium]NNL10719.1 PAS domain-containing protein [Pseudomonadales bacterium]NNM12119.1 PAS domain-containing protein [Pseudomonadales bacterium]
MNLQDLDTTLLENMSTAVLMLDSRLHISHINAAAEGLLSLSGARHRGEPIAALLIDADETVQILQETLDSKHPHTQREAVLQMLHGSDVVKITVDYTATAVDNIHGSALILEIQPIDRLLRINREASLFASQESSNALLKGLAHEIKNPLGGLRGAAQLLADEFKDKSITEYTDIIIAESDRLRNLVDRMLGPNEPIEFDEVNIHSVLERVLQLIGAEVGSQIELIRNYDPSIPPLYADNEKLIQAVLNIARNAVRALTEPGNDERYAKDGRQLSISSRILRHFTIGRQRHPLVCHVEVCDNGPGIPDSLIDKIFVPMVSGHAQSSGLGLGISQSIINQHHGLINCTTEKGKTCFSIYLPISAKQN